MPKLKKTKNSNVQANQTFVAHFAMVLRVNDSQGVFSSRSNETTRALSKRNLEAVKNETAQACFSSSQIELILSHMHSSA